MANKQLLLKDIDRMARQVHQLLHLAEVSDRKNFLFEVVDATAVVGDAIEHLTRLSDRLGVSIVPVLPEDLLLEQADGSALFVLVKNLLENALYHAPAGSRIVVDLNPNRLSVRDYGSGIAEADLPFIFRRFWRGSDRADNGAGLGLAICREIALAHGWALTVRNFQPGGAEFLVAFQGQAPVKSR
jgi:two-component system sensor histidine kinase QseC